MDRQTEKGNPNTAFYLVEVYEMLLMSRWARWLTATESWDGPWAKNVQAPVASATTSMHGTQLLLPPAPGL